MIKRHCFQPDEFLDKLGINGDHVIQIFDLQNHGTSVHIKLREECQSIESSPSRNDCDKQ